MDSYYFLLSKAILQLTCIFGTWALQMEKNVVAGRLTSTIPLSTPPPIASVTSPKFAPMSPVHVKTINTRPDSNNAYAEDDTNGTSPPLRVQADFSTGISLSVIFFL